MKTKPTWFEWNDMSETVRCDFAQKKRDRIMGFRVKIGVVILYCFSFIFFRGKLLNFTLADDLVDWTPTINSFTLSGLMLLLCYSFGRLEQGNGESDAIWKKMLQLFLLNFNYRQFQFAFLGISIRFYFIEMCSLFRMFHHFKPNVPFLSSIVIN